MLQLVPDAETLLALEPEELAGALMEHLSSQNEERKQQLNRRNFLNIYESHVNSYPKEFWQRVLCALGDAWAWLEKEGFLIPKEDNDRDWVRISRRGEAFATQKKVKEYRSLALLPKDKLDARLMYVVSGPFARGDYDTAVLVAFKQVEIAVRESIGAPNTKLGIELMRDAFRNGNGKLADSKAPAAEQEALGHLFAGAIGYFKNPSSHRQAIVDPVAAAEMVVFANHLLRIVRERAASEAGAGVGAKSTR